MLPIDQFIYNHPYLFRILSPPILILIFWILFGERYIKATRKLIDYVKESWRNFFSNGDK